MIAFVCHPYHRGGVTSWMCNAFLECQTSGISSKFITIKPKKPFISGGNRPTMASMLGDSLDVHLLELGLNFELATQEFRINVYRNLILNHVPKGASLIPSDDEACWLACLAVSRHYKVIGVLHSDDPFYYNLFQKYQKYLSATVSVSKRIKYKAEQSGHCQHHVVIPCGIFLEKPSVDIEKENQIIWIGRVEEEQKRVSDIIPIAVSLKKKIQDWKILVFGDGSKLNELKELTQEKGLINHIKFFGWVDNKIINAHLIQSKVMLQTSNYEGMSVAVMEGLGGGCSIVSSMVSGVEDLLQDSNSSGVVRLFPVGDIELAATQLKDALNEFSQEKISQAISLADERFSIQNCVKNYKILCESLEINPLAFPQKRLSYMLKVKFSWVIVATRAIKYKIFS
ncbi:glycosyltransferase [Algoriphagus sp.]|uniref:glycosyltransferase n=1 Tax=Algoriphagus sp. TaxID=1872435 RepID=UPI003919DD9A